ncbi:POTRA domain-containing protein [Gemmata sp. JC717]|uniref:POTRA domain-containing protein n=1 Tax=Gemmata algarum TaxID=2975278 RepID=UPI0021BA5B7B|nr:POTRA domain-containing protein [Gemmata algarum]MDY3555835.1 POTRA domain-containing protein [Gemmata algarum]
MAVQVSYLFGKQKYLGSWRMTRTSNLFQSDTLSVLCAFIVALLGSAELARAEEPRRIGRVIIAGNDLTPDWAIRRHLRIQSGDKVREADVRAAEERLRASKLFPNAPGRRPVVEVCPNELDAKLFDLLIRVDEYPWSGVGWGLSDLWSAARARDLDGLLRAAIFLKYGVGRLSDSWESRW